MNECFVTTELINFSRKGKSDFEIKRDPGTLKMKGEFEDDYGFGKFTFESNPNFRSLLSSNGIDDVDEDVLFQLFISNSTTGFIEKLAKYGNDISRF